MLPAALLLVRTDCKLLTNYCVRALLLLIHDEARGASHLCFRLSPHQPNRVCHVRSTSVKVVCCMSLGSVNGVAVGAGGRHGCVDVVVPHFVAHGEVLAGKCVSRNGGFVVLTVGGIGPPDFQLSTRAYPRYHACTRGHGHVTLGTGRALWTRTQCGRDTNTIPTVTPPNGRLSTLEPDVVDKWSCVHRPHNSIVQNKARQRLNE